MREQFERVEDSGLVAIEVQTDIGNLKQNYPWLFSLFIKSDAKEQESAFEIFLEMRESTIVSLEYEQKVKYVGTRVHEGWYELYFYAKSAKNLEAAAAKLFQRSGYKYECSAVKDAKWDFYAKNLSPTELEFHYIQSRKTILLLEEEGDRLSTPRDVEHYAVFDTATQKERFVKSACVCGFEFKDEIDSEEFEHGVAVIKKHALTQEEVRKVVEELYVITQAEHGYYEGWSTTLS